jgi:hypothetical protein
MATTRKNIADFPENPKMSCRDPESQLACGTIAAHLLFRQTHRFLKFIQRGLIMRLSLGISLVFLAFLGPGFSASEKGSTTMTFSDECPYVNPGQQAETGCPYLDCSPGCPYLESAVTGPAQCPYLKEREGKSSCPYLNRRSDRPANEVSPKRV